MNKFLKAIPEGKYLRLSIAHGIAASIHYQFLYKKYDILKLSHKTLKLFGVNRKCLKPYLELFQEAGLIQYTIVKGKSPIIQLLVFPDNLYLINQHNIKQYIAKDTTITTSTNTTITNNKLTKSNNLIINHTGVLYGTGDVYFKGQVTTKDAKPSTPTRQVRKVPTHQARKPTQQAGVVSKGGNR